METPLFSVVIPAYNRAKVINRTIDSVLAQSYDNYEIVVVDDGSTDNLKKLCDSYNSPKIKYIFQDNAGSNPARNTGIKHSTGKYTSFLDSDDAWMPSYLEEVVGKFSSDDEIGFVWTRNIKKFLPSGRIKQKKSKKLEGHIHTDVLRRGCLINSSCISAKRSLLEEIGGWDSNLKACQDDDICFRMAKAAKAGFVNKVLCVFYIDDQIERISSSSVRRVWNSFYLWKKHADDVTALCGKNETEKKFLNVYFNFFINKEAEGMKQCLDYISTYLDFKDNNVKKFISKCSRKVFIFRVKSLIKKLIRKFHH